MSQFKKIPDNVISVNFKIKKVSRPEAESLNLNPFAGFIDDCLLETDEVIVDLREKITCQD